MTDPVLRIWGRFSSRPVNWFLDLADVARFGKFRTSATVASLKGGSNRAETESSEHQALDSFNDQRQDSEQEVCKHLRRTSNPNMTTTVVVHQTGIDPLDRRAFAIANRRCVPMVDHALRPLFTAERLLERRVTTGVTRRRRCRIPSSASSLPPGRIQWLGDRPTDNVLFGLVQPSPSGFRVLDRRQNGQPLIAHPHRRSVT